MSRADVKAPKGAKVSNPFATDQGSLIAWLQLADPEPSYRFRARTPPHASVHRHRNIFAFFSNEDNQFHLMMHILRGRRQQHLPTISDQSGRRL